MVIILDSLFLALLGIITVNDHTQLDYETMPTIRLIVEASANTHRAYATVFVKLDDVNDNPPRFTQDRYVTAVYEGTSCTCAYYMRV